ncbi:GSCOCG00009926001-RA-CDS, partial [Cotesia congregata]
HFISTANKYSNCPRVFALFDYQHAVLGGTKSKFTNTSSVTKLVWSQLLESWNNSASSILVITSISGPPTHLTAGNCFCSKRWLASSSKPH